MSSDRPGGGGASAVLAGHFREMALNNAWSNGRLLDACACLRPGEFAAGRTSFFPSLQKTLNHILIIDWLYLDVLEGGGKGYDLIENEVPFADIESLREAQFATDRRLIDFCTPLVDADLAREVSIDRREDGVFAETVGTVLPHLFVHQIHHRGQAHAMLSGTGVPPPQLDEFFLLQEVEHRRKGLKRLRLDT